MKSYTFEYFVSDESDNEFLKLLRRNQIDLTVTYSVEGSRAWVSKVIASDDNGDKDITDAIRLLDKDWEVQQACEFDFTGRIVKEMFDNYPHLAEPELTPHQKAELLKLK